MKTLLVMRHAKSSWDDQGVSDHDRPLNARGLRTAPQMAQLLSDRKLAPDLIVSSTAERARETAFAVARAFDWQPEIRLTKALYMADAPRIIVELARVPSGAACVMVVGHNPGMEDLVSDLASMRQAMPTAAIARFSVTGDAWAELGPSRVELVEVWRPKEID